MAFIVEDGTGRVDSNAYTTLAFVLDYLTSRGQDAAWSLLSQSEQEQAVVAATDFIDRKYGTRFLGVRQFTNLGDVPAQNIASFLVNPADADTVTIDSQVYTFVAVLGAADDVLIGADLFETAQNFVDAINAEPGGAGVNYGVGTVQNLTFGATYSDDGADTPTVAFATVAARLTGLAANNLPFTSSVASVVWTHAQSQNGSRAGDTQALAFPRAGLVTRSGQVVTGVPVDLQKATAEYANRAQVATLQPDPTFDAYGGTVTRVKEVAGPVESDITYAEGSTTAPALRTYPMADQLLKQYLGTGGTIR